MLLILCRQAVDSVFSFLNLFYFLFARSLFLVCVCLKFVFTRIYILKFPFPPRYLVGLSVCVCVHARIVLCAIVWETICIFPFFHFSLCSHALANLSSQFSGNLMIPWSHELSQNKDTLYFVFSFIYIILFLVLFVFLSFLIFTKFLIICMSKVSSVCFLSCLPCLVFY